MPKFSKKSREKLETCHPLLQELFNEIIKHVDCTVIDGIRSLETQQEYVRKGVSKTLKSKHIKQSDGYSHAIDCLMYPIDWNDKARFYYFGGIVTMAAKAKGIDIRWGGDWSSDNDFKDQTFHDLPHFELRSTSKSGGNGGNSGHSTKKRPSNYLPEGPSEDEINLSLEDMEKDFGFDD